MNASVKDNVHNYYTCESVIPMLILFTNYYYSYDLS